MKLLLQETRWALWALLVTAAVPAHAIGRVTLTVGQLRAAQARISDGKVVVRLGAAGLSLRARAAAVRLQSSRIPPLGKVELACARLLIGSRLACRGGRFAALAGPAGPLRGTVSGSYDSRTGSMRVRAGDMAVAGGRVRLAGAVHSGRWRVAANATSVQLAQAAALVRPWFTLPPGDTLGGPVTLRASATDQPALTLSFAVSSADLNFSNGAGTVVSQHVAATVEGRLSEGSGGLAGALTVVGDRGQALAGPVYLDLAAHPLRLRLAAVRRGAGVLEVSRLDLRERGVIDADASALMTLGARPRVQSAQVSLRRLAFPGAYTSFLQMSLASTALGSLKSSGWASGSLTLRGGRLERINASLHSLLFADQVAGLSVADANGAVHWTAASGVAVARSHLSWRKIGLYGLTGGPAHLSFLAWDRNFALLGGNVRLPVFNGAILVHTLVGRNLGTPHARLDFNADLTPISMPVLCRAFGWPVMNGQLYGHIPLVQYRQHVLKFDGDLVAHVFGGVITGSHIELDDPLGQWPQMHADVKARGLDLGMVTRTFAFGSMSGRIDADINGLKLFDWSPVAFDARIYTMPGDRSPHLISQKAVTRIAAFGGGGGEVAAALESGVLQFFKTFHYRRLAIGCRLHNEVCHMSGVRPSDDGGYYLVEGSWLPRLDIIGNVRWVNWPQMLWQIKQGIRSGGMKVN